MVHKHLVITGTEREGTSFLEQLLAHLGLDTGYRSEDISPHLDSAAQEGAEHDITAPESPYVIRSPRFCDLAEAVLRRRDIQIDHVLVPMRDLEAVAGIRRLATQQASVQRSSWQRFLKKLWGHDAVPAGGLAGGGPSAQELAVLQQVYKLLWSLSDAHVPVTFLRYPRLLEDSEYLYHKLGPVLHGVRYTYFFSMWERAARPELMQCFNERDC